MAARAAVSGVVRRRSVRPGGEAFARLGLDWPLIDRLDVTRGKAPTGRTLKTGTLPRLRLRGIKIRMFWCTDRRLEEGRGLRSRVFLREVAI